MLFIIQLSSVEPQMLRELQFQ